MASRGCGTRVAGGVYLATGLSKHGSPVEAFLLDPPIQITPERENALGLSDIGVTLVKRPRTEIMDVWDIVGQTNYPNVADMIEEIKHLGISRRVGTHIDFKAISPESKLIMLHRRAWVENFQDYYAQIEAENRDMAAAGRPEMVTHLRCPWAMLAMAGVKQRKPILPHSEDSEKNSGEMCVGLYYEDIQGGELLYDPDVPPRTVTRSIGDTIYQARKRADEIKPEYGLAIFGSFPIQRIDVIRDRSEAQRHITGWAYAKESSLPVRLEDE